MNFIQLQATAPLFRGDDGATHISLPQGSTLRFGGGLMPLLDELCTGIPEQEWMSRIKIDSLAAQVDFTLREHHLIKQADSLQAAPRLRPLPSSQISAVAWWGHVLALLIAAIVSAIYYLLSAMEGTEPLPGWDWLLTPIVLAAVLLFHEIGHYGVARLCGYGATIKIWKNGSMLFRCEVKTGNESLPAVQKLLILAAGPWADCLLLLAATTYLYLFDENFVVRLLAMCALVGLTFNLWPNRRSDFFRMLSLAPGHLSRLWVVRVCWVVLPLMSVAGFLVLFVLFGFGLDGHFMHYGDSR